MQWASASITPTWSKAQGRSITVPFTKLGSVIRPKGGNCGIIIAAPGQGKTTFMLNWVTRANMKALYISSDTSPQDVTTQLAALSTGHHRHKVEERLKKDPNWRGEYASSIYGKYPHLVLDFSQRPTIDDIRNKAYGLAELWGEAPQMIVMDTASNVYMNDMSSNAEWQSVWLSAIGLAREMNCFFMFAHHVKQGPARSGRVAPEMNDGLWGSDQFAEIVIGLHGSATNEATLTVRKNRSGKKDVPVRFETDFAHALMIEKSPTVVR